MYRSKGTIMAAATAVVLGASLANWSWAEPAGEEGAGGGRAPVYLAQRVRVRRRSVESTQGQPGQQQQQQSGGYTYADQQMAACLIVDNENEIAAARLAQDKSENKDVREFAKGIVDDHQRLLEQLRPIAGNLAQAAGQRGGRASQQGGPESGRGNPKQQGGPNPNQQGGQVGNQQGGQFNKTQQGASGMHGLDFVRIKQEIGAQCQATIEREMRDKDASEFDKAFVGMQIAKHYELLDTLTVLSHHASPGFDRLIENVEEVTHSHLDHAKRLMKSLDSGHTSSDRSARRETRGSSTRDSGSHDSD